MDDIERLLRRYNLVSIGRPKKLDSKADILSFRDIENAEVYYLDFVIGVAMSAYIIQQELRAVLNLPEKFLVVRSDNEPIEIYSSEKSLLHQLDQKARDAGFDTRASLLSTDRHYLDAEQPLVTDTYGDSYNMKLLKLLRKVADTRRTETFQTSSDLNNVAEIQAAKRQPEQNTADFNAEFKGPKPVYGKLDWDDQPIDRHYVAPDGNFDDDTKKYFRTYKDARGQRRTEVMTTDPVRKSNKGNKQ